MDTTYDEDRDVSEAPLFDPFPEPQTMPAGWDLSGLVSPARLPAAQNEVPASDTPYP